MAKPRIFISSTFYDLKQIRLELDKFIINLGYEPVRNEAGDIPYGKDDALQAYCYKEIENVDILIAIIGGRFGSNSAESNQYSVSQQELKTAIKENKQVFIFIEKNVYTEYETYLLNKENENTRYKFVDNVNIYKFIEEIKSLPNNNNIKEFETAEDITLYLKEQFAGLFKQFILDQKRIKEALIIKDIENTSRILKELVDYIKEDNADKSDHISQIIRASHPIVKRIKEILNIPYNIYIEGKTDLDSLLLTRGYSKSIEFDPSNTIYERKSKDNKYSFKIYFADSLFENNTLIYIKQEDWDDQLVRLETINIPVGDDLPF